MPIKKKPFVKYDDSETEKEKRVHSVSLNPLEKKILEKIKVQLNQPKTSTAIKQIVLIGIDCLQREEMALPLNIVASNFRKNGKYTGLDVFKNDEL